MSLPDRIKEFRRQLGWSQRELAGVLDVRQATVSAWENGHATPAPGNVWRLAALVEDPRAVAGWLTEGGARPALRRYEPPSPGTTNARAQVAENLRIWLAQQTFSIQLLEEITQLLQNQEENSLPGGASLSLTSAKSSAEASRRAIQSMQETLIDSAPRW